MTGTPLLTAAYGIADESSWTDPGTQISPCYATGGSDVSVRFSVTGRSGYSGGTVGIRMKKCLGQIGGSPDPNSWVSLPDVSLLAVEGLLADSTTNLIFHDPTAKFLAVEAISNSDSSHYADVQVYAERVGGYPAGA